jgi:DNA mismatch repair ATPase MutS
MLEQYIEIKANNPDSLLFYRMGDFYEMFFDDAETASRALGIVLTKRGKHQGEDIPMCGVPIERADDYLQRLIGLGHRVAVCEQVEDPAEARKSLDRIVATGAFGAQWPRRDGNPGRAAHRQPLGGPARGTTLTASMRSSHN